MATILGIQKDIKKRLVGAGEWTPVCNFFMQKESPAEYMDERRHVLFGCFTHAASFNQRGQPAAETVASRGRVGPAPLLPPPSSWCCCACARPAAAPRPSPQAAGRLAWYVRTAPPAALLSPYLRFPLRVRIQPAGSGRPRSFSFPLAPATSRGFFIGSGESI